jgi:hypothetical protein
MVGGRNCHRTGVQISRRAQTGSDDLAGGEHPEHFPAQHDHLQHAPQQSGVVLLKILQWFREFTANFEDYGAGIGQAHGSSILREEGGCGGRT